MTTENRLFESQLSFEVPAFAMTLQGFRTWASSEGFPEQGKITFVAGRLLVDMSPERIDLHTKLKGEITYRIRQIVEQADLGDVYPDGVLISNEEADVSNEPDVSFASWETLKSGKLAPPADKGDKFIDLVGTPDWVCEIVSDSSLEKDTKFLREAYYKAGIPEYWLIDARGEEIEFSLLVAGKNEYQLAAANEGWRFSPVFDREFHLSRNRDQVNRWQYYLQSR